MKQDLAMRVLGQIMKWDDNRAREEFAWLKLLSDFKYDSYRDYIAGARFIESLTDWLQQFSQEEREDAYAFVRKSLLFFDAAQIQHLVDIFFPETVHRKLLNAVAAEMKIDSFAVLSNIESVNKFERLKRKCLFIGLSDGARLDSFRRANIGIVKNEQVVLVPEMNRQKWERLKSELEEDLIDVSSQFEFVFLIDDFAGTGMTLLRLMDGTWKGRLLRFLEDVKEVRNTLFAPSTILSIHHYVATERALSGVKQRYEEMISQSSEFRLFENMDLTYGMVLSQDCCITAQNSSAMYRLIEKYYDKSIEDRHTKVGGGDVRLGFGGAALPLVLEHNTPNNSIALLWAESDGKEGRAMRPLFRRRQRHSG